MNKRIVVSCVLIMAMLFTVMPVSVAQELTSEAKQSTQLIPVSSEVFGITNNSAQAFTSGAGYEPNALSSGKYYSTAQSAWEMAVSTDYESPLYRFLDARSSSAAERIFYDVDTCVKTKQGVVVFENKGVKCANYSSYNFYYTLYKTAVIPDGEYDLFITVKYNGEECALEPFSVTFGKFEIIDGIYYYGTVLTPKTTKFSIQIYNDNYYSNYGDSYLNIDNIDISLVNAETNETVGVTSGKRYQSYSAYAVYDIAITKPLAPYTSYSLKISSLQGVPVYCNEDALTITARQFTITSAVIRDMNRGIVEIKTEGFSGGEEVLVYFSYLYEPYTATVAQGGTIIIDTKEPIPYKYFNCTVEYTDRSGNTLYEYYYINNYPVKPPSGGGGGGGSGPIYTSAPIDNSKPYIYYVDPWYLLDGNPNLNNFCINTNVYKNYTANDISYVILKQEDVEIARMNKITVSSSRTVTGNFVYGSGKSLTEGYAEIEMKFKSGDTVWYYLDVRSEENAYNPSMDIDTIYISYYEGNNYYYSSYYYAKPKVEGTVYNMPFDDYEYVLVKYDRQAVEWVELERLNKNSPTVKMTSSYGFLRNAEISFNTVLENDTEYEVIVERNGMSRWNAQFIKTDKKIANVGTEVGINTVTLDIYRTLGVAEPGNITFKAYEIGTGTTKTLTPKKVEKHNTSGLHIEYDKGQLNRGAYYLTAEYGGETVLLDYRFLYVPLNTEINIYNYSSEYGTNGNTNSITFYGNKLNTAKSVKAKIYTDEGNIQYIKTVSLTAKNANEMLFECGKLLSNGSYTIMLEIDGIIMYRAYVYMSNSSIADTYNISGETQPSTVLKLYALNGSSEAFKSSVISNADGSYEFKNLYNGTYKIYADKKGYVSQSKSVTVNGNDESINFSLLSVYTETAIININVTEFGGNPTEGVTIVCASDTTGYNETFITDENGDITIDVPVSSGGVYYYLIMQVNDYSEYKPVLVKPMTSNINFKVPTFKTITGTVKLDSAPARNITVSIANKYNTVYTNTDSNGEYSKEVVVNDEAEVTVSVVNSQYTGSVTSNANDPIDLTLYTKKRMIITLRDADTRQTVNDFDGITANHQYIRPNDDGTFTVFGVEIQDVEVYGWAAEYESLYEVVPITEADMLANGDIEKDILVNKYYSKASFTDASKNGIFADKTVISKDEKVTFSIKYHNNGNVPLNGANVYAVLPDGVSLLSGANATGITTNIPANTSGSFNFAARIDSGFDKKAFIVPAFIEYDGTAYPIGAAEVEVLNISINAPNEISGNTAKNGFKVFGEGVKGSVVQIINALDNTVLYTTSPLAGRNYYADVVLPDLGKYALTAKVIYGDKSETSYVVYVNVIDTAIEVSDIVIDKSDYVYPKNPNLGIPTFSAMVDGNLNGTPINIKVRFKNSSEIKSVTYEFADVTASSTLASGYYKATISGWRGSGVKKIIAKVTKNDDTVQSFIVGEVVILIDPSGYIYDKNTNARIEGATVLLEFKNENGEWEMWDAVTYNQINPQITDSEGKYGWMVPEGVYRIIVSHPEYEGVVIEKYIPQEKTLPEEITVLPVRTDVNIGITAIQTQFNPSDPSPSPSTNPDGGSPGGGGGGNPKPLLAAVPDLSSETFKPYINGYEDNTIRPDDTITRAECAAILSRLSEDFGEGQYYANTFSDVPASEWYSNYIGFMQQGGYISGYADGTFKPDENITRAEFVAMLAKKFNMPVSDDSLYDDCKGHWAEKYISGLKLAGFIKGYDDGTFGPDKSILRAEVITLVNRITGRAADKNAFENKILAFSDIDSKHWAYYEIMTAVLGQ